jgi:hypothetical protein
MEAEMGCAAVGALASGIIGSGAAKDAARVQKQAADEAVAAQQAQFAQIQDNLRPFMTGGTNALNSLEWGLGTGGVQPTTGLGAGQSAGGLVAPFQPTMAQLEQTPGYQFTLKQGLESTQNSYAAKGLASSGAAMKGAANYAEDLASTTYQNQFNNYLAQNLQQYNMLAGLTNIGENAAAQLGSFGQRSVEQENQYATSGAAASAAGMTGSANALTGALGDIGTIGQRDALLYAINPNGIFGKDRPKTDVSLGPGSSSGVTVNLGFPFKL